MANIDSVKSAVSKQTSALGSVQSILNANIRGITNLDQLIENQSAGIVQSSASIEEMVGNITSVSNSVKAMSDQFKNLIEDLKKVSENLTLTELIDKVLYASGMKAELEAEKSLDAEIRLENPDMSLRELGESLSVSISRSGVNHRLQRICEISKPHY